MIDVADSTALTEDVFFGPDQEARNARYQASVNRPFKERVFAIAESKGGEVFSDKGDALIIAFPSAIAAAHCAIETFRSFKETPLATTTGNIVHLHAGLHIGYAERDSKGNRQGSGVNETARIEAFAGKDQILLSRATRELCQIAEVVFHEKGKFWAKGIGHLLNLWEIDWDKSGPRDTKKPPIRADLDQPPLIDDFVGRDAVLLELDRLLDCHRAICLEGMTGLGKTSSLVQLMLRRLRDEKLSDNAFFYFDCRAPEMRASEAGQTLLNKFGDYLAQLGTVDEASARVRDANLPTLQRVNALAIALRSVPNFLLLDNLQETFALGRREIASGSLKELLQELLQRDLGSSKIVFASFEHWVPPDRAQVHSHTLPPLTPAESEKLLERTGLADASIAAIAHDLTGGHPQALRWFSKLAQEQRVPVHEFISSLQHLRRDRYNEEEFRKYLAGELLDRLYHPLPPAAKAFLNAGALFRISPPFRAIQAASGLSEDAARDARVQIINRFLADCSGLDSPHVFHPLVREYCAHKVPLGSPESQRLHASAAAWWGRQYPIDDLEPHAGIEQHFHLLAAGESEAAAQLESALIPAVHQAGKAARRAGRLEEAMREFLWVVEREPQSADAHRKLAQVYARMGNAKAEEEFRLAEQLDSNSAKLHVEYSRWLYRNGRLPDALVHLQRAMEIEPGNAITRSEFRLLRAKQLQSDRMSIADLLSAINQDPDDEPLRLLTARRSAEHDGSYAAEGLLREGLERNPRSAHLRTELALILRDRGDLNYAERELRTGVGQHPADGPLRNLLGKLLSDSGRLEEAEEQLQAGIAANPQMPHLRNEYAQLLEKLDRMESAERQFRDGLAAEPTNGPLLNEYVGFLIRRGRTVQAEEECRASLAVVPEHSPLRHQYATLLAARGLVDDAEQQFRRGLDLDPPNDALRNGLARLLVTKGHIDSAEAEWLEGIRRNPRSAYLRCEYAAFLLQTERFRDALDHARAGLNEKPKFGALRTVAIKSANALNDLNLAEELLREGTALDPTSTIFWNELGSLYSRQGFDPEAENAFCSGLSHEPNNVSLCNEYARFLIRRARFKEACRQICAGLSAEPTNTYLLRTKAQLKRVGFLCECT